MNAMIAGILVSVPMPPEAFCAWKKRAAPLSEQATGPDLGPSPSLVDGASGNGSDTDRNRDISKEGVSNDPPVGGSRFVEEWNRHNSVKKDTYPASPQNARRNSPGDQGPQSRLLDGSGVDGGENDYVDSDDVVGVHVHGDHRQVRSHVLKQDLDQDSSTNGGDSFVLDVLPLLEWLRGCDSTKKKRDRVAPETAAMRDTSAGLPLLSPLSRSISSFYLQDLMSFPSSFSPCSFRRRRRNPPSWITAVTLMPRRKLDQRRGAPE